MSVFDKWNKKVDADFVKEVKDLDSGKGGSFKDVPYGAYEVKITKMELKESKNGDPMMQVIFKVLNGSEKGNTILMNQLIPDSYRIHIANDFLRSLDTGIDVDFKDYSQYNDLIMGIVEAIDTNKLEYALEYGQNEKGYDTFKIMEVFEAE